MTLQIFLCFYNSREGKPLEDNRKSSFTMSLSKRNKGYLLKKRKLGYVLLKYKYVAGSNSHLKIVFKQVSWYSAITFFFFFPLA